MWSLALFFIPLVSGDLLSVVVIYRHGDRTPIRPYPNDPYKNASYWPVGFGQLTNKGKERQYELGQWLRARYDGFLSQKYSENDIYVRSTDVDRTLMSAEANLAGLYPPEGTQVWNANLPWQPIPIHTTPELEDPLLAMKKDCPKYNKFLTELFKSPKFQNISHRNHDLYAYLTRYSGGPVVDLKTLEYLYSIFFIEESNNLTLPDWARKVYPDKLKPWAFLSFATPTFTTELARLKTGLLFNEILNHFENATDDFASKRKFLMVSAHDITIANVLNSLGAFEYHCPPYASSIIMELHSNANTSKLSVNLFYRNSTDPRVIILKGCEANCDFDKFQSILAPIRLNRKQWDRECLLKIIEFDRFESLVLLSVLVSSLFILIAGIICVKLTKRDNGVTTYMQLPDDEVA